MKFYQRSTRRERPAGMLLALQSANQLLRKTQSQKGYLRGIKVGGVSETKNICQTGLGIALEQRSTIDTIADFPEPVPIDYSRIIKSVQDHVYFSWNRLSIGLRKWGLHVRLIVAALLRLTPLGSTRLFRVHRISKRCNQKVLQCHFQGQMLRL